MVMKMKMKMKTKMNKVLMCVLVVFCIGLSMASVPIQDAKALVVYQSLIDHDTSYQNWTLVVDAPPTFTGYSGAVHPFGWNPYGGHQYVGYGGFLRKTFTSTNATNFTYLNITAYVYVRHISTVTPNIVVNIGNRLVWGDCYISNGTYNQNNQIAVTWSQEGNVLTNASDSYSYPIAQQGWSVLHYTGGDINGEWYQLHLQLWQTVEGYAFTYDYNGLRVSTDLFWSNTTLYDPVTAYEITFRLGWDTFLDDIDITYVYQTTPITSPISYTWLIGQQFQPADSPLVQYKSYVNFISTKYGGNGTQSDVSVFLGSSLVGNYTTDTEGQLSIPMTFNTLGSYTMTILCYSNDVLVKSLVVYFSVTAPGEGDYTPPWVGINLTLANLIQMFVIPGIVIGMTGGGVSMFASRFNHGTAGFMIGGSMGLVLCAQTGLVPMWFAVTTFILGFVALYFWAKNDGGGGV